MRLKTILSLLMLAATSLPLALFWSWPHSAMLNHELEEVHERHLLLAYNLGAALERYHRDVVSTFDFVSQELIDHGSFAAVNLMANLDIRHICLFTKANGRLVAQSAPNNALCPKVAPSNRFSILRDMSVEGRVVTSPVMPGPESRNYIYLVRSYGDRVAVAAFSTRYIQALGRQISFGVKGHAAIVDQEGNVLAHPLPAWIEQRRNIAELAPVTRMLAGETGVETFYSPALKSDMVAGFTAVQPVGWGVMVPQPLQEFHAKAQSSHNSALAVMGFGIALTAVVALALSFWLTRPLERLSKDIARVGRGDWTAPSHDGWMPAELSLVRTTFAKMVTRLKASSVRVNELAFIDQITGLGNRTYFMRRAERWLGQYGSGPAAMLFIDLDAFKPVNDAFGHHVGDQLIKDVAQRFAAHFNIVRIQERCEGDPVDHYDIERDEIILSRLGGDEFGLFLPMIDDTASAMAAGQRIHFLLEETFAVKQRNISIGASVGVALVPRDGNELPTLMKKADIAMYAAKRTGRNRTVVYDNALRMTTLDTLS